MTGGTETEGFPPETGQPTLRQQESAVVRFRKKPVTVDMIRWDGSDGALRLIRQHGGQPERLPDGSLNIWVEASDAEMNLDLHDWAVIEPDGSGVYPCRDSDHALVYEPADAPSDGMVLVSREDLRWALGLESVTAETAAKVHAAHDRLVAAAEVTR